MENIQNTDVSCDNDFQRTFNGFYIVRRNGEWRKIFYTYFERIKNDIPSFENIITYLYENIGNLEPSFASNRTLSDYQWLSEVKKVDCILWSIR